MTDETANGIVHVMTPVIMNICNIITPKAYQGKGEEKYGGTYIFQPDHPDLAKIKEKIVALAKARWPGRDIGGEVKSRNFKLPFTTGEAVIAKRVAKLQTAGKAADDKLDFLKGMIVLKAGSKFQPQLAIVMDGKVSSALEGPALALHKGKFYAGVECLLELNLKAYDKINDEAKDGVTAYLNSVVSLNRGKRLGGSQDTATAFSAYKGTTSDEDPTTMDDEIPF